MYDLSQFLIAFGAVCGIVAWFLFQTTLSKLVPYLQTNHNQAWEDLDHPKVDIPPYSAIKNTKLRQYILQKEYAGSSDLFVKNMGGLLRQRLLFCLFCLACLIVGLILMLIAIAIK
jgi:hypothetical protein